MGFLKVRRLCTAVEESPQSPLSNRLLSSSHLQSQNDHVNRRHVFRKALGLLFGGVLRGEAAADVLTRQFP